LTCHETGGFFGGKIGLMFKKIFRLRFVLPVIFCLIYTIVAFYNFYYHFSSDCVWREGGKCINAQYTLLDIKFVAIGYWFESLIYSILGIKIFKYGELGQRMINPFIIELLLLYFSGVILEKINMKLKRSKKT